jgi:hypothetical protein
MTIATANTTNAASQMKAFFWLKKLVLLNMEVLLRG